MRHSVLPLVADELPSRRGASSPQHSHREQGTKLGMATISSPLLIILYLQRTQAFKDLLSQQGTLMSMYKRKTLLISPSGTTTIWAASAPSAEMPPSKYLPETLTNVGRVMLAVQKASAFKPRLQPTRATTTSSPSSTASSLRSLPCSSNDFR
jgi:hypothetical protein